MKIIAATGHRPQKLGGFSDVVNDRLKALAIAYFRKTDPDKIISGMALGWDTAVALAAIELGIPLVAAIPFHGQELRWYEESQEIYHSILVSATEKVIVCPGSYSPASMNKRNEWMVDNCNHLVALWDGSSGGTGNCMKYAKEKVSVTNLWKSWNKYKGI